MPRVFDHHANKILIVGQSGHGKSVYQIRAAQGASQRTKFVFDHKSEFKVRAGALQCTTPAEIEAALPTGWVIYNPNVMFPGRLPEAFVFWCDFCWNLSLDLGFDKLFVADEVNLHTNGQAVPEFCRIMEDGRSVALDVLITAHGVNSLHNRVRGQVSEIVAFYHNTEPALDKLWEEFGINPDVVAGPINEETGEREGGLKPGEFIAKNMETRRYQGGRVF